MSIARDRELELIIKAKAGNTEALVEIWEAYIDAFKSFINKQLSHKIEIDSEDLDEILNEAFQLLMSKKIQQYDPNKSGFFYFVTEFVLKQEVIGEYIKDYIRFKTPKIPLTDLEERLSESDDFNSKSTYWNISLKPSKPEQAETFILFRKIFELAFSEAGYPHQQIVFGFIKLLQWEPREIVKELSNKELNHLTLMLEEEIITNYGDDDLRRYFEPLRNKMASSIEEVIPAKATRTRELIGVSLSTKVGETILPHYWGNRPAANLSNWVNDVSERISKLMLTSFICKHRRNKP